MTKNDMNSMICTQFALDHDECDAFAAYNTIRYFTPIDDESTETIDLRNLLLMLDPLQMLEFCYSLEICPIHACADEICIDDQIDECAHLR